MVNRKLVVLVAGLAMAVGGGCAGNSEMVRGGAAGANQGVFQVETEKSAIPAGYADVRLLASFKLHEPGIYPLESVVTHGTPDYKLLVNIDGQAALLRGDISAESLSHLSGPGSESGEGIRYNFDRLLRMKAGRHKVVVALPDDTVAVEREIVLPEGTRSILAVTPVYGGKTLRQRPWDNDKTHFSQGIAGIRVSLATVPEK